MGERRPTRDQLAILALLKDGPLHTRDVAKLRRYLTYDSAHASFARLEKRGFVTGERRVEGGMYGREGRWTLTEKGREAIGG